jgi:4-hydroxy-tetrahydrodipicolinate reductase
MGETVCGAVEKAADMELVGRADPLLERTLAEALARDEPEVVVDFTRPDTALSNALACVEAGVHVVIGTTGFNVEALPKRGGAQREGTFRRAHDYTGEPAVEQPGRREAGEANVFVAPNFAIGAILMMRFAVEASKHMRKAEIVELHHDGKIDAPSGTAARTAELMAEASGETPPIHSVRLPGIVANQEVILGDVGQTLTIRHDTTGRESFMPGVLLAIRGVRTLERSPVVGLEHLLFEGG